MVKTNTFNHLDLNDIEDEIVRIAIIELFDRLGKLEEAFDKYKLHRH